MCISPVSKELPCAILLGQDDDPLMLEFQAMKPLSIFLFFLSGFCLLNEDPNTFTFFWRQEKNLMSFSLETSPLAK